MKIPLVTAISSFFSIRVPSLVRRVKAFFAGMHPRMTAPKFPRIKPHRPAAKKTTAPGFRRSWSFISRKRPSLALILSAILVILGVSALSVVVIPRILPREPTDSTVKIARRVTEAPPLNLQRPLIPLDVPGLPEDYLLYRQRRSRWSAEEIQRWFVPPDENALKALHSANEKMIMNLLQETP
ncbi:MAG: hypothetical protein LBS64_02950 [Spirochaetaceae bacterium]|jgi:hypothetical protein|nr:hypothetical protein [Spirochaetaceae bacterium]